VAERRVFKPENGAVARAFEKAWCESCSRHGGPQDERGCAILLGSALHDADHPEYPDALVIGDDGPECAAFRAAPFPPDAPENPDYARGFLDAVSGEVLPLDVGFYYCCGFSAGGGARRRGRAGGASLMSPRQKITPSQTRAIHALRRASGMTDGDYRAHLEARFKVVSSRELSEDEAGALLDDLRAAAGQPKPAFNSKRASGKFAPVLQALWLAAYNLGIVEDSRDSALLAFVKRQCKVDHDRFLQDGEAARPAIEALKAMIAREAGVGFVSRASENKRAIVHAISFRIATAGLTGFNVHDFCMLEGFPRISECNDRQLDRLAAKMGAVLRRRKGL
jgi:hypothetical protein